MALPPFATTADVDARLPDGLDDGDTARAEAALADASAIIRAVAGKDWVDDNNELEDPLPDVLLTVACRAACRAITNPRNVSQESTGPFSETYADASPDVFLTKSERALVQSAAGSTPGIWTLPITTRHHTRADDVIVFDGTEYLPVEPDGQPIPFLDEGNFDG